MKRLYLAVFMALFLTPLVASAAVDLTKLTRLDEVSVHSDKGESRVVFRFAKAWKPQMTPVFYEKSIQFDIDGAYVNPSKRSFDFGAQQVYKVLAYQITPTKVRLRLFTKGSPSDYLENWKISSGGNLAVLTLNKPVKPVEKIAAVTQAVSPAGEKVIDEATKEKAQEDATIRILAALREAREKDATIKANAEKLAVTDELPKSVDNANSGLPKSITSSLAKSDIQKKGDTGEGFLNYKEPSAPQPPNFKNLAIKTTSALAFTLAAVFIVAWLAKKYMGKVNNVFGSSSVINVLATGSIGIKKQITVVDVAGETLILGVSDESITMLKAVDDEDALDRLRQSAVNGRPAKKQEKSGDGILKKIVNPLRIGKMKASPKSKRALFDKNDIKTFAGTLNALDNASRVDQNREELLRKLTDSIKDKNKKLRFA
ncbi:hypothetical protein MNBD_NITROSPINAE01-1240 [hydrothermal vent metagenome]|uniref:Flagellar protein n=1 Tax=hydrothermal vent metagenome TaxID=652676 RepID=A0A3B1BZ23_9ZZZZ